TSRRSCTRTRRRARRSARRSSRSRAHRFTPSDRAAAGRHPANGRSPKLIQASTSSEGDSNMSTSVVLPALGESVTEGTVTRWLKQVGDTVEVDEPLLEVSTDKVDTEIPSPVAGVLEAILVQEDET